MIDLLFAHITKEKTLNLADARLVQTDLIILMILLTDRKGNYNGSIVFRNMFYNSVNHGKQGLQPLKEEKCQNHVIRTVSP